MAESRARLGYGTILKRRTATSPLTYQELAEIHQITGPTLKRDVPDVTHMQSPNGFKEFLPGLKEGGDVTIEGNYIPEDASQNVSTGLMSTFFVDTRQHWILEIPDTGSPPIQFEFDAVLTGFEVAMPIDNKITFHAVLKISGQPTLA